MRMGGASVWPVGAFLMRRRLLMRTPIWLFRSGLGFLFGSRLLMVEHVGRKSGKRRHVVIEVIGRPAPDTYLVASAFGTSAQWYRNLEANPSARVWVGARRATPAVARRLGDEQADLALAAYITRHPRAWARLRPIIQRTLGRPVSRGSDLPLIALVLGQPGR